MAVLLMSQERIHGHSLTMWGYCASESVFGASLPLVIKGGLSCLHLKKLCYGLYHIILYYAILHDSAASAVTVVNIFARHRMQQLLVSIIPRKLEISRQEKVDGATNTRPLRYFKKKIVDAYYDILSCSSSKLWKLTPYKTYT